MLENMLLLNWWVATATVVIEIFTLLHIVLLFLMQFGNANLSRKIKKSVYDNWSTKIAYLNIKSFERYIVWVIFLFALASTVMSLVYSEIFLQEPCALCWWQRVFMYGVTVLAGVAVVYKDIKQLKNILVFSIFGAGFALYQHLEQILALYGTHLPCPVTSVDCSKMTIFEYSHITFPWMAFVLFVFFITIILIEQKLKIVENEVH
jgi:disulfide bond formation protein DsbB